MRAVASRIITIVMTLMTNVVDFNRAKTARDPHISGPAKCTVCAHEWSCVAPIGTIAFECPNCNGETGVRQGLVAPPEGALVFNCECGNDRFLVTSDYLVFCDQCGASHDIWL